MARVQLVPTMSPPSLPPEVVRLILDMDPLRLSDLVQASHVSHTWRIAARAHPTYSRSVSLSPLGSPSHGAVLFFLDRLAALPGGNLEVEISLGRSDLSSDTRVNYDMRTMVAPALTQVLPRLVALSIQCYEDLIPDMIAALRPREAPRLGKLTLYAPDQTSRPISTITEVLPLDLFSGHAPLLRKLQVDVCLFPDAHPVAALASVRELSLCIDYGADSEVVVALHPERFFVSCPALEVLFIHAGGIDLSYASWEACPPPSETNLRSLTLTCVDGAPCTEIVVRTFAHPGMRSLKVDGTDVNTATVELMISTLDDSDTLQLDVDGNVYELDCSLLDAEGDRRRTFWHPNSDVLDLDMRPENVFVAPFAHIARRFTRVSVMGCDYAWNQLVALFPDVCLSSVQSLQINHWEASLMDFDPPHKLALPALTQIELVADDVDAYELLSFVDDMLDLPVGRRLRLVTAEMCLSGDTSVLSSRFEDIPPSTS